MVNVLWHASTTHGRDCQNTEYRSSSWDCQNTAIVVGEFAAELRPYIYPKNIIYNVFLGSATVSLFCFCRDGKARKRTFSVLPTLANSSCRLAPHETSV